MAVKTLRELIRASGYTPAAGMSFRNNVPGATTGATMKAYNLYAWNNWATTAVGGESAGNPIPSGTVIPWTFNFEPESHWHFLRGPTSRMGAGVVGADPGSASAVISSAAWGDDAGLGNALSVTVEGKTQAPTTVGLGKNWFEDLDQNEPPYPGFPIITNWQMSAGAVFPSAFQSDLIEFSISYPPEADWNDGLTFNFSRYITRRITSQSYEIEWYSDSTYTTLVGTGAFYSFEIGQSGTPSTGTVYMRYKFFSQGAWTNYGGIVWDDPRINGNY